MPRSGLAKQWERRRRYVEIADRSFDAIDKIFDRVFTRIVRHYRRLKKDCRRLADSRRVLRRLVPLYRDLMLCGVYEMDADHRQFIARLQRLCHRSSDEIRMARAVARISR